MCLDVRVCVNVGVRMFVDVSVKMGEDKDCHCPGISAISGAFSWISPLLFLAVLVIVWTISWRLISERGFYGISIHCTHDRICFDACGESNK